MKTEFLQILESVTKNTLLQLVTEDEAHHVDSNALGMVEKLLQDPKYDHAEIMRQLWNPTPEEEDGKRSLFSKKMRNEPNDDGVPRKFDPEEAQKIIDICSRMNI